VDGLTSNLVTTRVDEGSRRDLVFKVDDDLDWRSREDSDFDDRAKDHEDILNPCGGGEVIGVLISALVYKEM